MKTKIALIASIFALAAHAQGVIGVTEPVHEIDLAFPESGIISEIAVEEGQHVKKGDLLIKLDSRIQEARARIAKIRATNEASVTAAFSEMKMNERRMEQVVALGSRNSNPDEIARAKVAFETAQARYDEASEESATAKIELEQIEAEVDRRMLRSPIDGIVARIYRDVAESVVGGDTILVTVVNLDQLNLVVHVPAASARDLKPGTVLGVRSATRSSDTASTNAKIAFVSPVVNASSGTILVRLEIDNADSNHESGVKYQVDLESGIDKVTIITQN